MKIKLYSAIIQLRFTILFFVWAMLGIAFGAVAKHFARNRGFTEFHQKLAFDAVFSAMWILPGIPLYWHGRQLHSYRRSHGLCLRCGFDLKGVAVPGKCPQCQIDLSEQRTQVAN
jgi:hypothetical protein